MQLSRLSILVLIAFLTGCASTHVARETEEAAQRAAAVLGESAVVAAEEATATAIAEEAARARSTDERSALLWEVWDETRCSIAIPCPKQQKYGNAPNGTVMSDLWWTFKYTFWGQGSSKDWPWSW